MRRFRRPIHSPCRTRLGATRRPPRSRLASSHPREPETYLVRRERATACVPVDRGLVLRKGELECAERRRGDRRIVAAAIPRRWGRRQVEEARRRRGPQRRGGLEERQHAFAQDGLGERARLARHARDGEPIERLVVVAARAADIVARGRAVLRTAPAVGPAQRLGGADQRVALGRAEHRRNEEHAVVEWPRAAGAARWWVCLVGGAPREEAHLVVGQVAAAAFAVRPRGGAALTARHAVARTPRVGRGARAGASGDAGPEAARERCGSMHRCRTAR